MNANISESDDQQKSKKSRHLPILDYFETLQIEYLVADLRHKIYPRLKDKTYWLRVKEGKKATIEKLATRNSLPTIFTDETMHREFEKKIYRDTSYPLFTYRDEDHKLEQEYYDLKYYYNIGSDVRIQIFEETKMGKISKEFIPFKDNVVTVTIAGVPEQHNINKVTRIL
jgi:Mg2+ and Co2+ transporter CorA